MQEKIQDCWTTLLANDRKNCQVLEDQHGKRPVKTNAWESSKSIKESLKRA